MLHNLSRQHRNARLTPKVRQEMVGKINQGAISQLQSGKAYGIHQNTVRK
jgi:hypothetical protein